MNQQIAEPGLLIGMDWADQKHDIYVIDRAGKGFHQELEHSAESIDAWVGEMLKLAGGQPVHASTGLQDELDALVADWPAA